MATVTSSNFIDIKPRLARCRLRRNDQFPDHPRPRRLISVTGRTAIKGVGAGLGWCEERKRCLASGHLDMHVELIDVEGVSLCVAVDEP